MTIWKHAISWSKFTIALTCELQLQYTIDKKPHGHGSGTFYTALGTTVQYIYERYYNEQINLKPGGDSKKTVMNITEKVLKSQWFQNLNVQYPIGKDEEMLFEAVRLQVSTGYDTMQKLGMLKYAYRSEVKWQSVFRGFRMFCMIDFLRQGKSGYWVIDGKGHAKENADPRQVLYYALAVAAAGHTIAGGGLLYWLHGYRPVDVSPKALRDFIDGDFSTGRLVFEKLKNGVTGEMPATPSSSNCGTCNWRQTCPYSVAKNPPMILGAMENIGFGEPLTPGMKEEGDNNGN